MGFNADIDIAGGGAGSSLSVNGGKTNLNADYKAVGEQSGIFTGDGGLDLTAKGKTTLIGGAITTTEAARDAGRNNYESLGGIETKDIENTTSYDGDAIQVGVSIGSTDNKPQASMNGLGYGTDSDSDSSVTRAGITGIAGNKDITTDNRAEYAGILENSFDAGRVNEELGAQTQITQEFGKEAPKAVAEFSQNRMDAIRANPNLSADEKMAAISKWDEGGIYRVAAHTALGALGTGSVEGALTTGGVAAAAPTINNLEAKMRDALVAQGMDADTASNATKGITSLALVGAGVAAGLDTSSTVTAVNVDANNRQLHPSEIQFILDKDRVKRFADKFNVSEEEAKQLLSLNAAAMYDYDWMWAADEIGASNPAVRVFLKQEAKNAGYPQLFNSDYITKEELSNPFINLKTTFDAYSGDKQVEDYINNVAIPVDDYLAQQLYKQGQEAGYQSTGQDANLLGDIGNIVKAIPQIPSYLIESIQSDEVGPLDSAKMKMYYDRLLRLQGNYYDAGFTSEKEFAEAQRLYWAGELLGAAGGAAVGQVGRLAGKLNTPNVNKVDIDNAQRIENNVNADNPSFSNAIRNFEATEGNPVIHRAEDINAGQVTDRDGLQRINVGGKTKTETKTISDSQVADMNNGVWPDRHSTGYPAWKPGTVVTDRVLTQNEKMRMVIDQKQFDDIRAAIRNNDMESASKTLGGWATKEPVNSVTDMRNRLAVTEEFKPNILENGMNNKFYVVEFEVQKGVGVREGTAGKMYDTINENTYQGNVKQINFAEKSPFTNPELFKIDPNIKEIK